jgi:rhodanese-related sulfurtransferase
VALKLQQMGFSADKLYVVEGGLEGWKAAGLGVE